MNAPLLSIVIPTYNRYAALQLLLADIGVVLESYREQVQIVICNNASTDGTTALIEHYRPKWSDALKVVSRKINIGMEGNIACSMLEGGGKYIWMLSDHQRLCIPEVKNALQCMSTLDFDIANAKLLQWSPVLGAFQNIETWGDIADYRKGRLFFSISNMSTLIFRRAFAENGMKHVFRCCTWGFPHLGLISQINNSTKIIEFDSMSMLPSVGNGIQLVHDYDRLSVRYCSSIRCIKLMSKQAGIRADIRGFFTKEYRAGFVNETLNILLERGITKRRARETLVPVIFANPLGLKVVATFVLLCVILIPKVVRVNVAAVIKLYISNRRKLG